VGEVWYTAANEGGRMQFWVEWIWIEPEHRRRGYALQAFLLLEEEARRLGAPRCGLDVWVDNPAAIALYKKLGYVSVSMSMVKALDPPGAHP
jgi:ribosomal protein S18 acetylase RimI-like enzyme